MFAGEGGPERTNKRFITSAELPAKRLSTVFDSGLYMEMILTLVLIFMEK
jgi:hypothetical protein